MGPVSLCLDPLGAVTGAANSGQRAHLYSRQYAPGWFWELYVHSSLSSHSDSPGRLDIISALRIWSWETVDSCKLPRDTGLASAWWSGSRVYGVELGPWGWERSLTCPSPGGQEKGHQEQERPHLPSEAAQSVAAPTPSCLTLSPWERKEGECGGRGLENSHSHSPAAVISFITQSCPRGLPTNCQGPGGRQ